MFGGMNRATVRSEGPLAYVVCAVAMGLVVLCFADAGSRVSLTGGPYAYVEIALGPFVGFLCGVLLWMTGTLALAAVSTLFVANLAQLVPRLSGRMAGTLFLVFVFAFLALVNIRGVRQGARLNNVFTVAKLLPLLLLSIAGAVAIDPANLRIAQPPSASAVAGTSILLIFSFAGVESALIPGGEMKDPARTVPRALLLGMVVVTVLYIWLQIVAQGVLGPDLPGQAAPLAEAAGRSLGAWGRSLLLIGASVSMFGYVGGMTLAAPRALYAFGRDGFLPSVMARVHPAYHTPYVAIATQALIACALAVTNTFEKLAILANVAALVLYAACAVAAWRLRRLDVAQAGTPFRVPGGAVIPWLACGVIAWMLTPIKAAEWGALLTVLVAASAVFALTRRRRSAVPEVAT